MPHPDAFISQDLSSITDACLPWEQLFGQQVLVTGASGFIGSYLVDTLACLNERYPEAAIGIHAMGRDADKMAKRFAHLEGRADFHPIIHNVCSPWQVKQPIHYIIHAASPASPKHYLAKPVETALANTLGTHHLLELARAHNARFLFLSSGTVYGQNTNGSDEISETDFGSLDPLDPRACYGESKRLGETLCAAYNRQHGVHTTIARISHTYGPGLELNDGRVFTDFIADLLADRAIRVESDGMDTRPFCYISDLIVGLYLILLKGTSAQAYNIGSTRELSILELAQLLLSISRKMHLEFHTMPNDEQLAPPPRSSGHFDTTKIRSLGWLPRVGPEQGFKLMYDHFSARHHDLTR